MEEDLPREGDKTCSECGLSCFECSMLTVGTGRTAKGVECDECGFVPYEEESDG